MVSAQSVSPGASLGLGKVYTRRCPGKTNSSFFRGQYTGTKFGWGLTFSLRLQSCCRQRVEWSVSVIGHMCAAPRIILTCSLPADKSGSYLLTVHVSLAT